MRAVTNRSHRRLFALALALLAAATILRAADAPAKTEPAKAAAKDGGYEAVGFDRLASFEFTAPSYDQAAPAATPPPKGPDQIPARIRELDGRKVSVVGFMLPVRMEEGLVKEFLLVKDPMMCCYGIMPRINEWVVVRMAGKGVAPLMDVPVSFLGTLRIGEMYENGYLTGIYLLEGERMGETKG